PVRSVLMRGRLRASVPLRSHRFERFLKNHHGARDVIAEPLALRADPCAQHSDTVSERQLIDDAQKIAPHRINYCNWLARVLDYADVRQSFAWSLPVPDRFEKHKVSIHQ